MIKSIQTGLSSILNNVVGDYGTGRGTNVTINSVDVNKCIILFGTSFVSRIDGVGTYSLTGKLTSSTNLQISVPVSGTYVPTRWQIIEFY